MIDSKSIKTRFFVSVAANSGRSVIAFITGLLVARGLNPAGYGDYSFLLGSFTAIRSILDMGSSSAFYTFIAQRPRPRKFYFVYFAWLGLQFLLPLILITALMPQVMIQKVWLGHARETILLAFVASFMQQQVWQSICQIGESTRKTVRIQIISMAMVIGHLVLVLLLLIYGLMSVSMLFGILIGEYVLATIWSFWFLRDKGEVTLENLQPFSVRATVDEFKKYCKPLMIAAWAAFVYEFADRWMLQHFGGAGQQGFYQIANQFSAVSLLATSSILNIFWKEIAEAHARGDDARVASVYLKVNRGLVLLGAILSGLLIPWTEQIVRVFLGQNYLMAVPVLMIMFLYPIHQSMGQICGTMFMASGYTHAYMVICVSVMLVSLPLTYITQAPHSGLFMPGLGLGATGMAIKMVLLNVASVNVQAWIIARYCKWKYDWAYQVVGISLVIGIGFMVKYFVGFFVEVNVLNGKFNLILPFIFTTILYSIAVTGIIWLMPWLIGTSQKEMTVSLRKLKSMLLKQPVNP